MKAIWVAALAALTGCGGGGEDWVEYNPGRHECSGEIDDLIEERGNPSNISTYDRDDGYHSHSYWYHYTTYSISFGFRWRDDEDGCDTSTYTT